MPTTEERLAELKELLNHCVTRGEYEYIEEQIAEFELILYYESLMRQKEGEEN